MNMGDNSVDSEVLQSYVDRIETLRAEQRGLRDDINELYVTAKRQGLNAKAIKALIAERAKKPDAELAETIEMYRAALGQLEGTELGDAAESRRHVDKVLSGDRWSTP